jgi:protein O-mannosyl-transferase
MPVRTHMSCLLAGLKSGVRKHPYVSATAFFLLVSVLLYGNTLPGTYLFDDVFFSNREDLTHWKSLLILWRQPYIPTNALAGMYRPMPIATYALGNLLLGGGTLQAHLLNILFHGVNTALVFFVIVRVAGDRTLALLTAMLFSVLPIHTEAVAYIKARDELLETFFVLLSWLAFLRATRDRSLDAPWLGLSAGMFLLALLSKEFAIMAPACFVLLFMIQTQRRNLPRRLVGIAAAYLVALLVYLHMRWAALGPYAFSTEESLLWTMNPLSDADTATRIWTAMEIAWIAIGKSVVPWNLSATYSFNAIPLVSSPLEAWEAVAGLVLLIALCAAAIFPRIRRTPLGFGAIIFLVSYLPMSRLLFARKLDMFGERWMYLPSIGICLTLAVFLLSLLRRNRVAGACVLLAVLLTYSTATMVRNRDWLSPYTLYASMVRGMPSAVLGHTALAQWYMLNGNLSAAREHVARGIMVTEYHAPLLLLYGIFAYDNGNIALARDAFHGASLLDPFDDTAHLYLAVLDAKEKQYERGLNRIFENFDSDKRPEIRFLLSLLYMGLGEEEKAEHYLDWDLTNSKVRNFIPLGPTETMEDRKKILREF